MIRRLSLVALLVLSVLPVARAADQTVLGNVLILKDPSTPDKRRITFKAKEGATDNTLVGNPVADGASVTISANGGTPSSETYALPAGSWSGDAATGFKYSDPSGANGPVKSAKIKLAGGVFQIIVVVSGKYAPVAVVPPNPGSDGCGLFTIGGGDSYSVQFANGKVTNKGAVLFKVAKPTSQGSCLPPTTTTTTSSSTTSSSSTTTSSLPDLPHMVPPGDPPLRYRDLVFATVTKTADVVYGSAVNHSGATITLLLDVYEPTGDTVTERPAIVWVHGGSFSGGDKGSLELVDESNTFARKGYLNVSINYRLEPGGCPGTNCITAMSEALADAQAAVRFLRTNASTYGVDVGRIAMGGSSAGAITALNAGFRTAEDPTAAIGAAVSLSGANLLSAIGAGDAPSLLFHGTADGIVPYSWATITYNQAIAAGLDSYLTTFTGAGHVPYVAHRTEILDQTSNFLYWELDLANAAQ